MVWSHIQSFLPHLRIEIAGLIYEDDQTDT
jgi:hypothetical protein